MKFGVIYELSVPRPFVDGIEQTVIENALEQIRLADELGFDTAWAVEHHFLEEYSHSSAPELFLTAAAMQTQRIRVGHAAVVCVPEMNHPIRVAERAAFLDILSGGRLEFGTARSSTWTELGGFQSNPDATKKDWDEYVRVLPRMWSEERFSHSGTCFSMPERAILPKPIQKPHPPMWVTVTSPGTELDAADRGIGCLGVAAASFEEQERRTKAYHARIKLCDPVGAINDQVSTLNFLYCHEDLATGAERGMQMLGNFGLLNSHLLFTREAYPTRAYATLGNLAPGKGRKSEQGSPADAYGVPEGMCIGDPRQIIAAVKGWESIGVDQVNFMLNAAEILPQEQVLESLRLFAREVMPAFSKKPPRALPDEQPPALSDQQPRALSDEQPRASSDQQPRASRGESD
jgi:alkanesulfonate monooxygenase SsuD/methylene tetrahydromethanopterin reductase-like flavin-dependent oxidoreductase (luciferase family)